MSEAASAPGGWRHWAVILLVFAITGTLAMRLSSLVLRDLLGLQGTFWGGPWSFRLAWLLLITPAYSALLVLIGTLLGKGPYFRGRARQMWRRLLPFLTII
jgi:hypothetical protein